MTNKTKSWLVILAFITTILFIFTPVFTGALYINNPNNIAIPETTPLSIRALSQNFTENPNDQTCEDSVSEESD